MGWWDEVKGAHKKALKSGHWAKSYDALWGDIEDPTIKDYLSGGKADVLDLWGLQEEREAKSAEKEAALTQEEMYMKGFDEQRRQYDQTRLDTQRQLGIDRTIARNQQTRAETRARQQYETGQEQMRPWLEAGGSALAKQSDFMGLGGREAQQSAYDNYSMSPGQQFLRDRGQKALLANASAIGGLGGGNVRSDLQQQGIGFAAQDFGNYYNRLAGMSGTGQTSAGQMGQMGASYASGQGQLGANYAGRMGQMGSNASNLLGNIGQNFGNAAAQQYGLAGNARASGIFGQQQASANQNNQMWNVIGSGAAMFSDTRLKEDIKKVSELNGHNLYSWTWKNNHPKVDQRGKTGFGVIAQEVERTRPDVISEHETGYKMVDYNSLFGGALCH